MLKDKINLLRKWIDGSNHIVFFGGAGVSTESKIPDFRSSDGIYHKKNEYAPETILSHGFFYKHTKEFYQFYKEQMIYQDAEPNMTHNYLAKLEREGKLKAIITQNIDGLHQKAGSINVLELHGSIYRNKCTKCGMFYSLEYILNKNGIPLCTCEAVIKPEVVLYEEELDEKILLKAIDFISKADMLIIGGTSLSVYPAAGLIRYYKGDKMVLINQSVTQFDDQVDLLLQESLGNVISQI